jgi:hypothetical protein
VTTTEVFALFQQYADEPDATWLTDADIHSYLDRGYDEFRRIVVELDPNIYYATVTITFAGDEYNLGGNTSVVRILGPSATTTRLEYLLGVHALNDSADIAYTYEMVPNQRALRSVAQAAFLAGTTLKLSGSRTGDVLVEYVPASDINWEAAGAFVDDLTMFHDVIALLAYNQYAIRDGAINQPVQQQLASRVRDLTDYVVQRNGNASHYVSRVQRTYAVL